MAHPPPPIVRATVVADGLSTNILAAGSGPPALLLVAEQRRLPILAALGGYFRVVAPEIPSPEGGPSDFLTDGGVHRTTPSPAARWLDGLLDGIGIEAVVIVADDTLSEFARSYSDSAPGRVSHLLVLDSGQDIAAALQYLKTRLTERGAMRPLT